jgi:hypothetical protein
MPYRNFIMNIQFRKRKGDPTSTYPISTPWPRNCMGKVPPGI